MNYAETLRAAADYIEKHGLRQTGGFGGFGGSACALGAIETVTLRRTGARHLGHCSGEQIGLPYSVLDWPIHDFLKEHLCVTWVPEWSDHTTKDDVIAGLRSAADRAEKEGK